MKFTPPLSAEQQLETQVNQLKQQFKRRQFPKKNAPALPLDLLVTISGCTFGLHSQKDGRLVLKADKAINFDKGVNVLRSVSYIAGDQRTSRKINSICVLSRLVIYKIPNWPPVFSI